MFLLLVAFVFVVRSTCLSPECTPAARMLGELLRLRTAGVITGLNVENNRSHSDVEKGGKYLGDC